MDQDNQPSEPQTSPSPDSSSANESSPKKGPIVYVAVLLLLLIGGGAFYFGLKSKNSSKEPSPTPSPSATSAPTPTEEPDKSPTPTKKPSATPTPKPTATPTPISFQVTGVVAAVSPTSSNSCPTTFNFTANITTNAAGTVTYKWERSDGATGATENLVFDSAQTKTVETTWNIENDEPPQKWERVHILTPNDISSNQATFTLNCP